MRHLVAVLLLTAACTSPPGAQPPASSAGPTDRGDAGTLIRVDDGDSLVVSVDGRAARVRLIGINAPEQGECLSDVARERLRALVEGRDLVLVEDAEATDRFDRLLRYVYVDGELVNAIMAAEGLAVAHSFEPNIAQQALLDDAQSGARAAGVGIWDPEACGSIDAELEVSAVEPNPPGPDIDGEYVEIRNTGSDVELTGFSIRDESSHNRYDFPPGTRLASGDTLRVFTGCGVDSSDVLFWCSPSPVWDNAGDTVFLVSSTGSIQASFTYGP